MLILSIETSTSICSIAVLEGENLLSEWYVQSGRTHSTGIMEQLEGVLSRLQLDKTQIEAVAVNIGPGSFTGLRIGLSLAKALCIAWGIPIVGIASPDVLACNGVLSEDYLAVLIDAQRNNFYYTLYQIRAGVCCRLTVTEVLSMETIGQQLAQLGKRVLVVGDYPGRPFGECDNVQIVPEHLRLPRAYNLGLLAYKRLAVGDVDSAHTLGVDYLKVSEAERLWVEKQSASSKV